MIAVPHAKPPISDSQAPEPKSVFTSTLGRNRLLLELGEGGTANVYLAAASGPSGFNKLVVIKALKKELAAEEEHRRMFLEEARLSSRLNHSNIVQVYDVIEDAARPFIVLEYLDGQALVAVVSRCRKTFPTNMYVKVIADMLRGLHYAHELQDYEGNSLGLVHRDINPHNVFVTFDGQIKLLDFGIAKLNRSTTHTNTGALKGKLGYMAPEQIAGEAVDRRCDVFGAGCMLWEAAAHQRLSKTLGDKEFMRAVLNAEIPKPSEYAVVDARLEQLVMKALATEPDDRFATAEEMQGALEEYLLACTPQYQSRDVGDFVAEHFDDLRQKASSLINDQLRRDESDWERLPNLEHTATGTTALGLGPTGAEASFRGRTALVALSLVALLALTLVLLLRPGPRPEPSPARPPESAAAVPVTLDAKVQPEDAVLFLDDAEAGVGSFSRPLEAGSTHTVRAEAKGYATERRTVTMNGAMRIDMALRPVAAPAPTPAASISPEAVRKVPPKGRAATRARAPDCDPPYYFDADGLKHYRPECLK